MQRRTLTVVMNVLVLAAIVLTAYVVVRYFGVLAHSATGTTFLRASAHAVPNFHLVRPRSLYGGVFDADAALMVIILLALEWVLSVIRGRV